jgi:hypothetical protein
MRQGEAKMKMIMTFVLLCFGVFQADPILSQEVPVPRNKIVLKIDVRIDDLGNLLRYSYNLRNDELAEQGLWQFRLIVSKSLNLSELKSPKGWDGEFGARKDKEYAEINWGTGGDFDIFPGASSDGFSFVSKAIPGIITYYAEGYAPPPSFEPGMATDEPIPGYDDLTPYGPGIVGKTVGPILPPEPFVAIAFIDIIANYKHQSYDLGWIDNQGIVNSLDAKLDNAKKHLEKGQKTPAINELKAFVNEVEAQKDKHLKSGAYALLKYNAEYLMAKLSE